MELNSSVGLLGEVPGEGVDSMANKENFCWHKGDLHDGKLCLPPNLTLNNIESIWLPGIKQLVPFFECMCGGRGQGCRGGWV